MKMILLLMLLSLASVVKSEDCHHSMNSFMTNKLTPSILIKEAIYKNSGKVTEELLLNLVERFRERGVLVTSHVREINSGLTLHQLEIVEVIDKSVLPAFALLKEWKNGLHLKGYVIDLEDRLGPNAKAYFDSADGFIHLPLGFVDQLAKYSSPSGILWHETMHALFDAKRSRGEGTLFDAYWFVKEGAPGRLPGDIGMYKEYFSLEEFYMFAMQPYWFSKVETKDLSRFDLIAHFNELNDAPKVMKKIALKVINLTRATRKILMENSENFKKGIGVVVDEKSIVFKSDENFDYAIETSVKAINIDFQKLYNEELRRLNIIEERAMMIYEDYSLNFPAITESGDTFKYKQFAKNFADNFRRWVLDSRW